MHRVSRALWSVGVVLVAGCTVTLQNPNGTTGTVLFDWSFTTPNGDTTCAAADVQVIEITLGNGIPQDLPCNDWEITAGQSAEIDAVPLGPIAYTIKGLSYTYDADGNLVGAPVQTYTSSGTADVTSGIVDQENVTLTPLDTTQSQSNLVLLWSFGGKDCNAADVSSVTIQITDTVVADNNVDVTVACVDMNNIDGDMVTNFAAGAYPFVLTAQDTMGNDYYAGGTLSANGVTDTTANLDLQVDGNGNAPPTAGSGSLTVNFSFDVTGSASGCTVAGVDTLQYFLTDDTGALVPASAVTLPCTDPLQPVTFAGLNGPATYILNAQGLSGNTPAYALPQDTVSVSPARTSTYSVVLTAESDL